MPYPTFRIALLARALAIPAHAAPLPAPTTGIYALPDNQAKVSASLTVTPRAKNAPLGTRVLDVAMVALGSTRPITRYEVELSKQMHLIAVSDDLRTFLHAHGERPGADGHFGIPVVFPRGGGWHVYADAVPAGLGQQVMRFDVNFDDAGAPPAAKPVTLQPTGLTGSDGRYSVKFDALDLRAGQESQLTLHLLRDEKPAPDLAPFLGVVAHAVFIDASDLTYIHAHAAPVASGGTAMRHGPTGKAGFSMAGMDMSPMDGPPLRPGTKVSPDLMLHVRAAKAGTYLLWLQFSAGGRVRTVPFVVSVA